MFSGGYQLVQFFDTNYLPLFVSYLILWGFVIYIVARAKKNSTNSKAIETVYEPPSEISAILARYILVAGKLGGVTGEISENGLQRIMLIDLYENGALKELHFLNAETITYEIDENCKDRKLKEEQLLFINLLEQYIGKKATIKNINPKDSTQGFAGIQKFWLNYWHVALRNICIKRGYFDGKMIQVGRLSKFLAFSMTFGVFFALFLWWIPFVGPFITAVLLFPVLLILLFSVGLVHAITYFSVGPNTLFESFSQPLHTLLFVILPIMTWFIWCIILGQNIQMALSVTTEQGKEIIRKIKGHKDFLEKVDKDRVSFSLDRDLDFKRNNTTFSWLAIFDIVTDRHWEQWYEAHSKKSILPIDSTI